MFVYRRLAVGAALTLLLAPSASSAEVNPKNNRDFRVSLAKPEALHRSVASKMVASRDIRYARGGVVPARRRAGVANVWAHRLARLTSGGWQVLGDDQLLHMPSLFKGLRVPRESKGFPSGKRGQILTLLSKVDQANLIIARIEANRGTYGKEKVKRKVLALRTYLGNALAAAHEITAGVDSSDVTPEYLDMVYKGAIETNLQALKDLDYDLSGPELKPTQLLANIHLAATGLARDVLDPLPWGKEVAVPLQLAK